MVWVLVVDDDAPTRDALRLALEDAGYAVLEAGNGSQALDILRRSRRRLVALVDLLMPETSGVEMLQAVAREQELARRHRYIAMTAGGETQAQSVAETLAALKGQMLMKPFGIEAMLTAVTTVTARRRRTGE